MRKWSNKPKMSKFWPLTFKKQPFEWFNQILLMICCLCHPKEASCKKRKKVIEQFLRKWSNKPKMSKFWPLTFKKQPFEWFNQILLMICCVCHPKEASCKKRKKVIEQFLRKWSNKPKMSKFWPLTFKKQPFQILLMICCLCHPKEASCKKRKKVIEQFLRKWSNKPKMSKFWPLTFKKQPFEWFNQILLMICCLCHPKEASCKKRKKVIEQFLRKLTLKFVPFDPMLIFRPPKPPVRVIESH